MNCKNILLILLLIIVSSAGILGQDRKRKRKRERITQRFVAGIIAGINYSQIHGDTQSGFDKQGITGGIKVITQISPALKLNVELLYIEKGSRLINESIAFVGVKEKDRFIKMNFIEIPVLLKVHPKPESNLYLEGGISIGRKISSEIKDNFNSLATSKLREIEPDFTSTDISTAVGFGININKDISLGTRFTYALTKIYDNPELSRKNVNSGIVNPNAIVYLRNYAWQVLISYNIF